MSRVLTLNHDEQIEIEADCPVRLKLLKVIRVRKDANGNLVSTVKFDVYSERPVRVQKVLKVVRILTNRA